MNDKYSSFTNFYFESSNGFFWILLNLLLTGVHLLFLVRRRATLRKHIADLGIVAVTGIFGFIAVNFFQNKFYD